MNGKRLENAIKEMEKVREDTKARYYCDVALKDINALCAISMKDMFTGFCRTFDYGFIMGMRYAKKYK